MSRTLSTIHPHNQIYVAFLLHGMSLSSQGFWNTVIYVGTSWPACQAMWRDIKERLGVKPTQASRKWKNGAVRQRQGSEVQMRMEMRRQKMAMLEYKTGHTRIKEESVS